MTTDPLEIVNEWIAAANAQDVERLVALSDPQIEIVGPRGSGFGHQLLRDWLARAGLELETLRRFARGGSAVLVQRGLWRSMDSAEITGDTVALVFAVHGVAVHGVAVHGVAVHGVAVHGERVVKLARFDSLEDALRAAGLSLADEIA